MELISHKIEAQRLGNGQSELMAATRAQNDLDARFVRAPQGSAVLLGKLHLGIEQGAIDIDGDEPNRAGHNLILSAALSS